MANDPKVNVSKQSGSKPANIKVTPSASTLVPMTQMFQRPPDPPKGAQNPSHWHVK
jgi:hypothetical protein